MQMRGKSSRSAAGVLGGAPAVLSPARVDVTTDGTPVRVVFEWPVWKSLKNDVRLSGGRLFKGGKVTRHKAALKLAAAAAAASVPRETRSAGAGSLFGADDVRLQLEHLVETDTVRVTVERLQGTRTTRSGRTGRGRDVHNLLDTLADALEGAIYDNDRQLIEVRAVRDVGGIGGGTRDADIAEALTWARSWEPDDRLLGKVTAGTVASLLAELQALRAHLP